ncbi:endonuclease III domain-containing protein [Gracilibacillus alcaliphilus]|uniref:endonuclease III domain-containing protein n=1 Tax=Gracilibacillus alcaliphilus TaxID=1401441 RepID=UPI00195E61D9|nr:endonuclease III domain-containing protein [Gracilibacillus alcaliphilus]MBM7676493.1 endonuclease-3 related protein [Gracilibacillus alcaliphilus]
MQHEYTGIYQRLFAHYGPQGWWPAETPFEMMIGAILVQNTNWRNVEKALVTLGAKLDPETIDKMSAEELAPLIKSSGFFNLKARRIKAFIDWFKQYQFSINQLKKKDKEALRAELIKVYGIGRETADCILLYALEKPVFVVDAYTRRIFYRIGYDMPVSYDRFKEIVEQHFPGEVMIYNEFHALLVAHAKQFCRVKPVCTNCPLLEICQQRVE